MAFTGSSLNTSAAISPSSGAAVKRGEGKPVASEIMPSRWGSRKASERISSW